MIISVYDSELRRISVIETFASLFWQTKYNSMGSFTLEMNIEYGEQIGIHVGDYIGISDDSNTIMVATSIEVNEKKAIIRGYTADYMLSTRVSDVVVRKENAEEALRALVASMNPIPHIGVGESVGIPDKFETQTSDQNLQEYCSKVASAVDMGYRLRKHGDMLLFECYKPTNPIGAKYSASLGNLTDEKYMEGRSNYANVAVVAGQGEGEERVTVTVGETDAQGLDRVEIYVDARHIQRDDDEPEDEYIERLSDYGLERLAECSMIQNTQFTVDDDTLSLGDIVHIFPTYSSKHIVARVVSVSIKSQKNTIVKTVSVGDPIRQRK